MKIRACVLLLAVVMAGPVSAAPILSVQPASGTYTAGNAFSLDVQIDDVGDLYAFQFDLEFDPAILVAIGTSEGPFLGTGGATFFIPGDLSTPGVVAFTANTLIGPGAGVSGSGVLATVAFKAFAPGSAAVALSNVLLLDSAGAEIDFFTRGASVAVNPGVPTVPEPVTVFLFGLGLAGVGYRRRR